MFNALPLPKWKGNRKKAGVRVYFQLIHSALQQQLTQLCKATPIKSFKRSKQEEFLGELS